MSYTFVNARTGKEQELKGAANKALESIKECLEFWQEHGKDSEDYEYWGYNRRELLEEFDGDQEQAREVEEIINTYQDIGDFFDYGLSFDFVEADENTDGYYRYQLSWGGPSEEIRFYVNGAIEFVYLDWFVGIGINCTSDSVFKDLRDEFKDMDMLDWDMEPELLYRNWHLEEEEK